MLRHGEERLSSDTLEAHGCHERRADRDSDIQHAEQLRALARLINSNEDLCLGAELAVLHRLADSVSSLLSVHDCEGFVAVLVRHISVCDRRDILPCDEVIDELLALLRIPLIRAADSLKNREGLHALCNGGCLAHADFIVLVFNLHFFALLFSR